MRIVHIQQYYNDGMGYQENILPKYHKKLGNEVMLITSNLSNGFDGDRNKEIGIYNDGEVTINRIGIKGEFKNRFVIFRDLYKVLENFKPDYIFHHSVTSPSLGIVCNYKKKNPEVFLCADNHADLNISARSSIWKKVYYNTFWKKYISKYDKYIDLYFGVTASRCIFLNEELGVNFDKIRLLPIGADTENIKNISNKKLFLRKFNIDENKFIITHGGKITKEKQVDRILQAFSQIEENNICLIIFGKIEDEFVKKLIKKDSRIINLGWLDRMDTLSVLKYSDIGIWNTQHTTLLEDAVAVGLPLIIRYYGSTSHLIDNSGLFLYDGSIREIYDKMNFIIKNKEILSVLKKNALKMSDIISYNNIALESIEYANDTKPKKIHEKFMKKNYSDYDFKNFRVINRE